MDGAGRLLAVLHRLDRQIQPAGTAVATGPHAGQIGLPCGIGGHADVLTLAAAGAKAFLVGESLMRQQDVTAATRAILTKP